MNKYCFHKRQYSLYSLAKWIPSFLGIPRNSLEFLRIPKNSQLCKLAVTKKAWNSWEFLGMKDISSV